MVIRRQYAGVIIIALLIIVFDAMTVAQTAHADGWRKITDDADDRGDAVLVWEHPIIIF